MSLRGRGAFAGVLTLVLAAAALTAGPASAAVNWAGGTIGAANLDGSDPNPEYFKPPFPSGSAGPECGLAVKATHLYWAGASG